MSVGIRHIYADEPDLRYVLTLPYCSLGSDGVVVAGEGDRCRYPWNASTYGYAARTIEHYVCELGLFSLEEAVHRLAGLPAEAIGLRDRGLLIEGALADVVIFEARTIRDRSGPDDMARYPEGVRDVLVNGVPCSSTASKRPRAPVVSWAVRANESWRAFHRRLKPKSVSRHPKPTAPAKLRRASPTSTRRLRLEHKRRHAGPTLLSPKASISGGSCTRCPSRHPDFHARARPIIVRSLAYMPVQPARFRVGPSDVSP